MATATATAKAKAVKYDPEALYEWVRGTISHKGNRTSYTKGDGQTFNMKHRNSRQIEYLVEVKKTIALAGGK